MKTSGNSLTLRMAVEVQKNVVHKLEKYFDRQKFAKTEHLSGEIRGASREGTRDVGVHSVEDAKPNFGKINQWAQPNTFQSEHHEQNRWQACMCVRALVKTEANM